MTKDWRCTHGWLRGEQCEICLSQPAQELVAWLVEFENGELELHFNDTKRALGEAQTPLYTAPQPRPWVGLTSEQRKEVLYKSDTAEEVAIGIEAQLKKKNTVVCQTEEKCLCCGEGRATLMFIRQCNVCGSEYAGQAEFNMAKTQPAQEPPSEWALIKNILHEHGLQAISFVADWKAAQPAQPAQEPVGYEHHEYRPYGAPGEIRIHAILASQYTRPDGSVVGDYQWLVDEYKLSKNTIKLIPLYTTPQQRSWVGLTDEEIKETYEEAYKVAQGRRLEVAFARVIEAKLKEKNT